jgi:hypothetical protein
MYKQKYETYNVEFNIRKNLKTKRPTEGYKTEQERDGNIKGNAYFKGDAVRELWEMWRVQNNKEIRDEK